MGLTLSLSVEEGVANEETRPSIAQQRALDVGSDDLQQSRADGLPQLRLSDERVLFRGRCPGLVVVGESDDGRVDEVPF